MLSLGIRSEAKKETAATVAAVAEPEARELTPREFDQQFADEYLALAKELGINAPSIELERATATLEQAVASLGLRVYDRKQVSAYLTSKYGPPKKDETGEPLGTWAWRPLRATDSTRNEWLARERELWQVVFRQGGFGAPIGGFGAIRTNGEVVERLSSYDKPVPMPVLLTVKEIATKHPDAKFFVSDEISENEARPIRDPFLMVRLNGVELIIERWDEPNYRER